ncbi:LPXTG cell wall anchor domain-containing protein [Glycomyces sp. TRM65418]|uniref:LPXTG cell wall anchor domain-containing protein n=1 Tax=Glycomyces sp. TRM65418 TaxID=2867006 RepID=UPI001CE54427|nr:LPXTG cell wall anchor domain-containing protein [Glycomyces sp. TRM65418]MCC3765956.1 LPXTG cell wall anchor domain-containing protein [Glycomyces sp. TRM65418]QZD55537.1 LPXTG cell wall anchor domain-containing protein [Glycomyces sp. TRM65418]
MGTAALSVGAFALPAAAQAPVPVTVEVDFADTIVADDQQHEGGLTIEFGEDFAEGAHEVTADFDLDLDSTGIRMYATAPEWGGCGVHAGTGLFHCVTQEAGNPVEFAFRYAASPDAAEGVHDYTVTIGVDGETVDTIEGSIEVVTDDGGDGYARPYLHGNVAYDGVEPGSTVAVTPQFLQDSALPEDAAAVVATTWAPEYLPHGLAWPGADYDNCIENEGVNVTCVVTDFQDLPGTAFFFGSPIDYTVHENAPGPIDVCDCVYEVYTIGADELESDFGGVFWDEDSNNLLRLEPLAEPTVEFHDEFQGLIDIVTAANPFDLAVSDANAKGADGAEVTITVPVKNLGPAHASRFFDGPGSYGIIGSLPKGLELVRVDSDGDEAFCFEADDPTVDDSFPGIDLAKADFICLFQGVDADESFDFEFTVKVTDSTSNAKGTLEVAAIQYDDYPGVADANPKNNLADITVNGTGNGSGQLPKTGTSMTTVIGVAALVLVAGAVLLVLTARKRRTTTAG